MNQKKLKYPTTTEEHIYMKEMQSKNRSKCLTNKAENWMKDLLNKETALKWTRQAIWGYRLFDFWNPVLGIAVEVDGLEHNKSYDSYRDTYNFERSGIIVLRVRNCNETDAIKAIDSIRHSNTWLERRTEMGLLTKAQKKSLGLS